MYKAGATTNHGDVYYNRYMTSYAAGEFYNAVSAYLALYTGTPSLILAVNDMSLPYGGVLDLSGNWIPPHQEHWRGVAADYR